MALSQKLSELAANAAADAVAKLLSAGTIRIYDGAQPASADEKIGQQTLLATLKFGVPAFERAVNGEAVAKPILSDDYAAGSGKASWFRAAGQDGAVVDGSVGVRGANLNLNNVQIEIGARVSVSRFTYTQDQD